MNVENDSWSHLSSFWQARESFYVTLWRFLVDALPSVVPWGRKWFWELVLRTVSVGRALWITRGFLERVDWDGLHVYERASVVRPRKVRKRWGDELHYPPS